MRGETVFVLGVFLCAGMNLAQRPAPSSSTPPATQKPQTVYYAGPGVTAPELLPITLTNAATGRCKHLDATATLSVIVDAEGVPHNVYFVRPTGNELDQEAITLATAERFKPGTQNGSPAATVDSIEMNMRACIEKGKDEAGKKIEMLRLQSVSRQKLSLQEPPFEGATLTLNNTSLSEPGARNSGSRQAGGSISAPHPILQPEAMYSDEARRERISGECLVSLIVDANGMPQKVHLTRSLEPSLDEKALEAVRRYRFRPAMKKDGTPVPVAITIEISFHLY